MKIKKLQLKIILLIICLFVYLFIGSIPTRANELSLSLTPSIITINAIAPANVTSSLSIQNKSDAQITLQIQLKPFQAKGENGELEYFKESLEIFKNIQIMDSNIPVENITLGPKQKKNLSLNIAIPQHTNISDYYFSIVFTSINSSSSESNSSLNQIGIAANVLLSVGPLETPRTSIEEFSSNIFFEKGPVPFTIRVKNTGSHFIRPMGKIIIKNIFGQNIGKLDLVSVNVLSNSIRAIPNALWKEDFLLGLYTATLNISMSGEDPVIIKEIHFFAFPFQGLIMTLIAVIAIVIINKKIKARMRKNP